MCLSFCLQRCFPSIFISSSLLLFFCFWFVFPFIFVPFFSLFVTHPLVFGIFSFFYSTFPTSPSRYRSLLDRAEERRRHLLQRYNEFLLAYEAGDMLEWIQEKKAENTGVELDDVWELQKKFDEFQKVRNRNLLQTPFWRLPSFPFIPQLILHDLLTYLALVIYSPQSCWQFCGSDLPLGIVVVNNWKGNAEKTSYPNCSLQCLPL